MVNRCCKCSKTGPGLFSFPAFADDREVWRKNLELPLTFLVQAHSRVCFRHFSTDSYSMENGRFNRKLGKITRMSVSLNRARKPVIVTTGMTPIIAGSSTDQEPMEDAPAITTTTTTTTTTTATVSGPVSGNGSGSSGASGLTVSEPDQIVFVKDQSRRLQCQISHWWVSVPIFGAKTIHHSNGRIHLKLILTCIWKFRSLWQDFAPSNNFPMQYFQIG